MRIGKFWWLGFLALAGVGVAGCRPKTVTSVANPQPIAVVQGQAEATMPAQPDSLAMTYIVANRGDANLRLGPASTTCGCSKAAIQPGVVPPGGQATVTVVGQPPVTGSRTVKISVATNDPGQPKLIWTWDLVGHPNPPRLLTSAPVINLGILRPGLIPPANSTVFDLLEDRNTEPLLSEAVGDQATFRVTGGLVDQTSTEDHRLVKRTYRYTAQFVVAPEPGRIAHQIDLRTKRQYAPPWLTIPIRGVVLPAVRALPSSFTLMAQNGDVDEPTRLIILTDDHSSELEVECVAHDPALTVRFLDRAADRVTFAVVFKGNGAATLQPIQFRIRQPVSTTLQVPVTVTNDS